MTMSFHPPVRPPEQKKTNLTWYEELLEKDELLLYVTASLGILLPGIVYLIYHKVHTVYMNYALKKEAERIAGENARCEVALVVVGEPEGVAATRASQLRTLLKAEMTRPPYLWITRDLKSTQLSLFKGAVIYFVDCDAGKVGETSEWLFEWLEDVAADSKQKRKTEFGISRFCVAGFDSSKHGDHRFNKGALTLIKRLKILGSKHMTTPELFDNDMPEAVNEARFGAWTEHVMETIDRNLPGNESQSEYEDSSETDSDASSVRNKKKM